MKDSQSITIKNLEAAVAGESMAHIKYMYFAKLCRAAGDEATAKVFEDTAAQEVQHAFGHAELLFAGETMTAMVNRHLIDSLSVLPHLTGQRILDGGTGAGLPGVPLAICCPERAFHLLDSNGKKMRFLFQVKTQLGLGNLTLVQGRAETLSDAQGFDTVLARAVGSLAELLRMAGHLLAGDGSLLAMKSGLQPGELASVPAPYTGVECIELQLPGGDQRRQLVRIRRAAGRHQYSGTPA